MRHQGLSVERRQGPSRIRRFNDLCAAHIYPGLCPRILGIRTALDVIKIRGGDRCQVNAYHRSFNNRRFYNSSFIRPYFNNGSLISQVY